jgi:endonuclease/exonuclease/phosphatase family metal-dependent hydrolase
MPVRIAQVLQEIRADVIGLQEVESVGLSEEKALAQMDFLAGCTNLQAVPGPTLLRKRVPYGNVLLSRFKIMESRRWDISAPGREPRGVIDAMIQTGQGRVRILVTHFGLSLRERRIQAGYLMRLIRKKMDVTTILLGDINGWHPYGGALRILRKAFERSRAPLTFPSRFPLLPLDRIWLHQGQGQADIQIRRHWTPLSSVASDHLPVKADIRL